VAPVALPVADWLAGTEGGLQDPAIFLGQEAAMAGEELVWEAADGDDQAPGLDPTSVKLQLTYFESTVEVEEATEALAVAQAARLTLQQAGPWVGPEELAVVTGSVKAALPMALMAWLPPLYNAEHVPTRDPMTGAAWVGEVPGRCLYRASVLLGPVTLQAVAATLSEAVACLAPHAGSLLRTRDLSTLTAGPLDGDPLEPYVRGQGVMQVAMEEAGDGLTVHPVPVLPPLDLHLLQLRLAGGRLPAGYGARDEYGCVKVALCLVCQARTPASHEALFQVRQSGSSGLIAMCKFRGFTTKPGLSLGR
jgi:hypothetical protein